MKKAKEIIREVNQSYLETVFNSNGEYVGTIRHTYKRKADDQDRYLGNGLLRPVEWLYNNN